MKIPYNVVFPVILTGPEPIYVTEVSDFLTSELYLRILDKSTKFLLFPKRLNYNQGWILDAYFEDFRCSKLAISFACKFHASWTHTMGTFINDATLILPRIDTSPSVTQKWIPTKMSDLLHLYA